MTCATVLMPCPSALSLNPTLFFFTFSGNFLVHFDLIPFPETHFSCLLYFLQIINLLVFSVYSCCTFLIIRTKLLGRNTRING